MNRCIKNILKLICLLQNNSSSPCNNEDCTRPCLGPNINGICYNTRVISLYTKNGTLFTTTYINSDNVEVTSSVFKVISVDNNVATLLILNDNNGEYLSTNNFITININCICAIRCIVDVAI